MPGTSFIIGGVEVPLITTEDDLIRVIHYRESGMEFTPKTTKFVKPRDPNVAIDLITVHDQGGEGEGKTFFDRIRTKGEPPGSAGLSVHFEVGHTLQVIDDELRVVIYQFNDPITTTTAHMGGGNSRSIGIECSNRFSKATVDKKPTRPLIKETYRKRTRTVLGHTDGQKIGVYATVLTLLHYIRTIPRRLPRDAEGKVTGDRLEANWAGVIGHHHMQPSGFESKTAHVDPCGDIFDLLLPVLG